MSNARKLRVQIRAIVWRRSAGERAGLRRDGIRICIALQPLLADSGAIASSTLPTISRFAPMRMRRRGVELRLVIRGDHPSAATLDPALLKAIAHARSWFEELRGSSDIAGCTRDPCECRSTFDLISTPSAVKMSQQPFLNPLSSSITPICPTCADGEHLC
jgi:hypothetical protein